MKYTRAKHRPINDQSIGHAVDLEMVGGIQVHFAGLSVMSSAKSLPKSFSLSLPLAFMQLPLDIAGHWF